MTFKKMKQGAKRFYAPAVAGTFKKMKQGAKRFYAPAVAGASLLAGSGAANAAVTIDVDDVVQTITGGVTVVSAIGVAVLSLVVVIKLFKWVRAAL